MTTTGAPSDSPSARHPTMKAITADRYGPPDILTLQDLPLTPPGDNSIIVRVHAAALNPMDVAAFSSPLLLRLASGSLRKPKQRIPGGDVAGIVEVVGKNVTAFKPGDEVFGVCVGAFAEYARLRPEYLVRKPSRLTFPQAAGIPVAAITALQGLRDQGRLEAGQRVLIYGASGGVGTFAVQIAKTFGAHVTAVCSTRNLDLVRRIGADETIDYTREDFARSNDRYDVILDVAGTRSIRDLVRVLVPNGTLVLIGAKPRPLIRVVLRILQGVLTARLTGKRIIPFLAKVKHDDLRFLADLAERGDLTPVVDRTYPLERAAEAFRYLDTSRARGKIILTP